MKKLKLKIRRLCHWLILYYVRTIFSSVFLSSSNVVAKDIHNCIHIRELGDSEWISDLIKYASEQPEKYTVSKCACIRGSILYRVDYRG